MKKIFSFFILLFLFSSCNEDKRIYIKSITFKSERVDWYFFSLLSGFSKSYLSISKSHDEKEVFFKSFYLSDIEFKKDTLTICVYKNKYEIDVKVKTNFIIIVDTSGQVWNQASSRLGRLQKKHIDFYKPHNEDTYCPDMECY